jgi:hypothetical protein
MHEIGHALDASHGLGEKIGLAQSSERREEINFARRRRRSQGTPRARRPAAREGELEARSGATCAKAPRRSRTSCTRSSTRRTSRRRSRRTPTGRSTTWRRTRRPARAARHPEGEIARARRRQHRVQRIDGKVIKGYYYGPPDAVRLLENYLSPGLRGNVAFDLYRAAGNFLNQVQLGLSVFHVLTTATNSTISRGALALEQASRGQIGAAVKNAALTSTLVGPPILDVIRGHRYLRNVLREGRAVPRARARSRHHRQGRRRRRVGHVLARERARALPAGDPRHRRGSEGRQLPGRARPRRLCGLAHVPAAIELLAKPVMEWWVPRLKLAAFMDLARMELRDLGPKPDPLEAAKVLGRAWDSIDNRFGELIYDNIFWHGDPEGRRHGVRARARLEHGHRARGVRRDPRAGRAVRPAARRRRRRDRSAADAAAQYRVTPRDRTASRSRCTSVAARRG